MTGRNHAAAGNDDLNRHDDRLRSAALLAAELHSERYDDPAYLEWLYDSNPLGPAVDGSLDDDVGRVAHYALIPQAWRGPQGLVRLAISLNAAVATRAQRGGRFTGLARDLFDRAAREGIAGTLTVANANSTPAFLTKLGLRLVRPLPVRVFPAAPGGAAVESMPADDAFLAGSRLDAIAREIAAVPVTGLIQQLDAAQLRWRLASPIATYCVHVSDAVIALSTTERAFGTRGAVLLKCWPRRGCTGVSARPLLAAVCRHHRAPFVVYAGFNAHVRVPGVPMPRRLLPSPLNLLAGAFVDDLDPERIVPDTYEFLDADHY